MNKHVVYLVEFTQRKLSNQMPFWYIGSKSNCTYDGTHILDTAGKPYFGSSSDPNYHATLLVETPKITLLGEFDEYDSCLDFEAECQTRVDAAADPRYWNLIIAKTNNYHDPEYATYKHVTTGKTVRIKRDHPGVLSGEYVGVSSGMRWFTNGSQDKTFIPGTEPDGWYLGRVTAKLRTGELNHMVHSPPPREWYVEIARIRSQRVMEDPDKYAPGKARQREIASKTHAGIPKTPESNEKRSQSSKGYITLKNSITMECVRVQRSELDNYDLSIWVNPYKLAPKKLGAVWYNNGEVDKKIFPGDEIPEGFVKGRKKSK